MIKILLVSSRPDNFKALEKALQAYPDVEPARAETAEAALKMADGDRFHLAVLDSAISDADPQKLAADFIAVNAMMNTAMVSGLSDDEFHEKTEGLGILMRLPEKPGPPEARKLLEALKRII